MTVDHFALIEVDGWCTINCDDKPGKVSRLFGKQDFKESFNKVAYPPDRSTTCQENGEWTNPIQCRNVCPPEILTQGELTLGGVTITMEFVTTVTCEAAQEAAEEDAEVQKISPRDTSIEDLESIFAGKK